MNTITNTDRVVTLEKLLVGLLDGIDGYEAETGTLQPFWRQASVDAARTYLESLPDGGKSAGYWLARPIGSVR